MVQVLPEIPAELMVTGNAMVTDKTVAILTSKSGDTKETVAVAKWLAERNVTTISFCGEENTRAKAKSFQIYLALITAVVAITGLLIFNTMLKNT